MHHEHIRRFGQSGVSNRRMGALGKITGVRAGGEEFSIEASISQVGVEGRRYFTVILRDITERERLEKELAEREGLLRTIIETEPECVKVMNLDGTVQTMNAAGLGDDRGRGPPRKLSERTCVSWCSRSSAAPSSS